MTERDDFLNKIEERQKVRRVPQPFRVFYHIACLNHWREVVAEQLRLAGHVRLSVIFCTVLGSPADVAWCVHEAGSHSVALSVVHRSEALDEYETPTLVKLREWAVSNPSGAVLYWHTKGVSAVSEHDRKIKAQWRRLMQRYLIGRWRKVLVELAVHDIAGVAWQSSPDFPHFAGNFWMARCDWLSNLDDPYHYRQYRTNAERVLGGHKWIRMHAEMWLGSRAWHHVKNLYNPGGSVLWTDAVFRHKVELPGFAYA